MIVFKMSGIVKEKESGVPLPNLFVKAYDKDLLFDDLLGSAITDAQGRFEIISELADFREFFDVRPDIYFKIFSFDRKTQYFSTEDAVRWSSGRLTEVEIRIPHERVFPPANARLTLTAEDGASREELEAGESLTIQAHGLRPVKAYDILVSASGRDLFASRLLTNSRGEIEPMVLWPQLGMDDPRTGARLSFEEARQRWQGVALDVVVRADGKDVLRHRVRLAEEFRRPVVISTDSEGRILNGFERGAQALQLSLHNLPFQGAARIYMVERQHDWNVGDPFAPATLSNGEPAIREIEIGAGQRDLRIEFASASSLPLGAWDFIVRPIRYGYEEDDERRLLRTDVISGRRTTGVVIREAFLFGKPVLGGCVNKIPVSGRSISGTPYFRYSDTFEIGESVYGAFDPGIVNPGNLGNRCALYVVQNKTDAQWNQDNSLSHLQQLGGNIAVQKINLQSGCINANKVLLWSNAQSGEYDIVADFGANMTPDAMAFQPDNAYNTPQDIIDGYFQVGFRVIEDPGTFAEAGLFAGNWNYDENVVTGMGMTGTVSIDDEDDFYETPGSFSVLTWQVPLKAHVFFPADAPNITDPAQISATKADFPLIVIVHGNGHSYTSYDFLLQHFAKNGFIAASIHLNGNMHGLGRANVFFQHLAVLRAKFGNKVQNNMGIMGHSRGGEAVVKVARLNQQQGLPNNINAVMSLAPTDQYGREVFGGAFAKPFFVLYGSRDADVAGWNPADLVPYGYNFTWRMTGLSLYDRASGAPKSVAFVYRATHNGFVTVNDFGADSPISEAAQKAIVQAYANAFFRQTLRGESKWEGMFTGEWRPASVSATGAEIYCQYRAPNGKVVDDFEGGMLDWQSSSLGGGVSHGATLPANPGENRIFDYPPNNPGLDPQSPHDTQGLKIRWDNFGDRLVWTIPPAHKDVSAFGYVSLRVTQKQGSMSNPSNQAQDFRVTLKDANNNQRAIRASAFGAVPFPDQRQNVDLRKSALSTIRIPLTSYTIVCAGQPKVDLQNIVELALDFSLKSAGEIEVDDIEFTN